MAFAPIGYQGSRLACSGPDVGIVEQLSTPVRLPVISNPSHSTAKLAHLAVALGCMLISTAHAGEPPSSCKGLLSDRDLYAAVNDAVVYTMVFNHGSSAGSDKIFSDLAYWLERKLIWLEDEPILVTRLNKITSEINNADIREQITDCYPGLHKFLHPTAAKQAEAVKQAEAAERAERAKLAKAAKQLEDATQAQEAARQAWESGAPARSQ